MDSFSTPRPHTSDRIGSILGGREVEVAPPRSGRRHYVSNVAPPRSHAEPITACYAGLQSRTFNDRLERNKSSEQRGIATPSMRPNVANRSAYRRTNERTNERTKAWVGFGWWQHTTGMDGA